MTEQEITKAAADIAKRYLPAEYEVVLFGSQARGGNYMGSDIDIGILGEDAVPYETMMKITEEKDELPTLRKIDIVDLRSVDASFRENVLSYARRI